MIFESWPWKQDLKYRKREIIKNNTKEKLLNDKDDFAYTRIEKGIFYSAFIIRKLMDCHSKVSDEVDNYTINVEKRNPIKRINYIERAIDDATHDWENYETDVILAREVCNQLIHSFLFSVSINNKGVVDGFFVSSDRDKNIALYYVSLADWLEFVDYVSRDDVVMLEMKRNDKGELDYTRKKRGD